MPASPAPQKLHPADFARRFVNAEFARQLPADALEAALESGILWRGLLAVFSVYAAAENAVVVRPDDAADLLPPGVWAALTPAQLKQLRGYIHQEANDRRKALRQMVELIKSQCAALDDAGPAFRAALADKEAAYLAPATP